jgi:hypothetical protein
VEADGASVLASSRATTGFGILEVGAAPGAT